MDYLRQSAGFQIRKVARYARMYGLSRTWSKVCAQRHMVRRFDPLPPSANDCRPEQRVALVGCGNFAYSTLAWCLTRKFGRVIGACMDIDPHRAASLARAFRIPIHTDDFGRILDNYRLEMLFIASNHASHAEYAVEALERGMHVFIEKPHVVSEEQLRRLHAAMRRSPGKVFLGFNRPASPFGQTIAEALAREEGPIACNWFVAGHVLGADHWYHHPQEAGRVFGNLCHWIEFTCRLAGDDAFPVRIVPVRSREPDADVSVSYVFNNGTLGTITFASRGEPFEGVRERFTAQRGNCLIAMDDFKTMTVDVGSKKRRYRLRHRDHGHAASIETAYRTAFEGLPYDAERQARHVVNIGQLMLRTREAIDRNEPVIAHSWGAASSARSTSVPNRFEKDIDLQNATPRSAPLARAS